MHPAILLSIVAVCIILGGCLGRKSRWYLAVWVPLAFFTAVALFALLRSCSASVGNGPEAGFAAMGRAFSTLIYLPSIIFAPLVWAMRPRADIGQTVLPLILGISISLVSFFSFFQPHYEKVQVCVFDSHGKPVSRQFIYQTTTLDGVSSDGPTATTDSLGVAQILSRSWKSSTFKTHHSDGYGLEVTWQDRPKGGGIWSFRWSSGLRFGMGLEASPPDKPAINLYLRKWDELEMPVIVEQIRLLLERAERTNTLPNIGSCLESLKFIPELTRLRQNSPALRPNISAILDSQAAMVATLREVTKFHQTIQTERSASFTIQALIIWATPQDQVSSESIQALQLKLTQTGQQILEAALPLIGDRYGGYQAFAHLKDLAIPYLPQILERFPSSEENGQAVMLPLFRELRLGFEQLGPLAKDASPGFAMTILMAVKEWQNLEQISEAIAIVEAKEKEFKGKDHANMLAVEDSFRFAREQLQWATQKLGSASSTKSNK